MAFLETALGEPTCSRADQGPTLGASADCPAAAAPAFWACISGLDRLAAVHLGIAAGRLGIIGITHRRRSRSGLSMNRRACQAQKTFGEGNRNANAQAGLCSDHSGTLRKHLRHRPRKLPRHSRYLRDSETKSENPFDAPSATSAPEPSDQRYLEDVALDRRIRSICRGCQACVIGRQKRADMPV